MYEDQHRTGIEYHFTNLRRARVTPHLQIHVPDWWEPYGEPSEYVDRLGPLAPNERTEWAEEFATPEVQKRREASIGTTIRDGGEDGPVLARRRERVTILPSKPER